MRVVLQGDAHSYYADGEKRTGYFQAWTIVRDEYAEDIQYPAGQDAASTPIYCPGAILLDVGTYKLVAVPLCDLVV
jgi:hypothetical protein